MPGRFLPARASGERGVALIVTLFLMAALSALAASLMFLSQTETYSTMNYQMMSQARYAGESGVEKTVNYLLNTYPGHMPGTGSDPTSSYDMTKSPVTCTFGCTTTSGTCTYSPGTAPSGPCVVLSAMTGVNSNYPISSTATEFTSAAGGTLPPTGSSSIGYSTYAVLMSMQTVGSAVVQTWSIVSNGTVSGARTAQVQVISTLETPMLSVTGNSYSAFATGSGCGSMTFGGSANTASYNSSAALSGGKPVTSLSGGNVGTNGNLTQSGTATINGKLYTPRTGVGTCNNGGGGVAGDAVSQAGSATVTGGLVQLASTVYPSTPLAPTPAALTTAQTFAHATGCGGNSACTLPNGASNPNIMHWAGGTSVATATLMGDVQTTHDVVMHLGAATGCPCYYTMNSLVIAGGSSVVIDGGPVIINITGATSSVITTATTPVVDLEGGGIANATYVASNLQINYAGAHPVTVQGGFAVSAVIDSPNAPVSLLNGGNLYGAVLGSSITDSGGTTLYYDMQLNSMYSTQSSGNPLLTSFSWKKY